MKKVIAILLALLLPLSASAETIDQQIGAPEYVTDTFVSNTGKTIITVEADVEIPDVEHISVLYMEPTVFTADDIRTVAQVCFTVPYPAVPDSLAAYQVPDEAYTSSYRIRGQQKNAAGVNEQLDYFQYYQVNGTPREGSISFDNAARHYQWKRGDETVGEPSAAAMQTALSLAEQIAPAFDLAYVDRTYGMNRTDLETPPSVQTGSRFVFTRSYQGVPSVYTSKDCTAYDNLNDTYVRKIPYEVLYIIVDDLSGVLVEWRSPHTITGVETENVRLLSFAEIMRIAGQLLPLKYTSQEKYLEARNQDAYRMTVNRITLSYTRVQSRNDPSQYLFVPVWDFFDANDPLTSLLTISAIDGTAIDRGYGS